MNNLVNFHIWSLGSEKVKEMKAAMEDGPDLGDFIAGVVPREGEGGYSGKLKLEKGGEILWNRIVSILFRRQKVEAATLA